MRFAAAAFCRCRAGWRCCFVKLLPLFCINDADAWLSARCGGGRFAFRNGLPCRQYGLFQASMRPVPEWGGATPTCIRLFVNILLRQGRSAVWQGQSRGRRLPPLRRYPGRKSARWLPECMENHEKTHFLEKKAPKVLRFQKNALSLHSQSDDKAGATLGYGVMVTLQILVLSFLVRVRVSQQRGFLRKLFFCLSAPMPHLQGCHAVCRAARRACKCLIFPNLFCPFAYLH